MPSILARTVLALILTVSIGRGAAAQAIDPQVPALSALRTSSRVPLSVAFRGGLPKVAQFDVTTPGASPAAQARGFLTANAGLFLHTGPDQGLALESIRDLGGLKLVSFLQTWKGVPIFGARATVGLVTPAAGGPTHAVVASAALQPDFALAGGLDVFPSTPPSPCIAGGRTYLGQPSAPVLGQPRLMIFEPSAIGDPGLRQLVWAYTLGGPDGRQLLCSVATGAIVHEEVFENEGAGLADLDLDLEDAHGETMKNTNCFNPTTIDEAAGDEDGLYPDYQSDVEAINEWWNIRDTYLFYHDSYGRHSTDDDDYQLEIYIHSGHPNASSAYDCGIQFKTGWVSYEVSTHEFTHAVMGWTSGLAYHAESGALNESYADTMATVGAPGNWLHAEDRTNGQGAIRSLSNPPQFGQPDQMSEYDFTKPDTKAGDWGGVHTNSGIPNKAHYLAATGFAFNGRPSFAGMGTSKLGIVSYLSMQFISPYAFIADARALEVGAAQFMAQNSFLFPQFGLTNTDACALKNGWAAVEVGFGDFNCDGADDGADDPDGDFIASAFDNCPNKPNPSQKNSDGDAFGDACDNDADGDGIGEPPDNCVGLPNWDQLNFDGDAAGNACDSDDDNDGVADATDNCPDDPNPSQADANHDGAGDACDPDNDGDGVYVLDDNCTFVVNPSQTDTDGDGLGDACDLCPNVADWTGLYSAPPFPGGTPKPVQLDSDEDGTPDACDTLPYGGASALFDGQPYNARTYPQAGARPVAVQITGPVGALIQIPLPVCDPDGDPDPAQITEVAFTNLADSVAATLVDERGIRLGRARHGAPPIAMNVRGLRTPPNCARNHYLEFSLLPGFPGSASFTLDTRLAAKTVANPWTSTPGSGAPPPPRPLDGDRDSVPDLADTCPDVFDPDQADADADRVGDLCDNCRLTSNPRVAADYLTANPWATLTGGQRDDDHDGYGNKCDADFTPNGNFVGSADLVQFRASNGRNRTGDTCGTASNRPCAMFDLDEVSFIIGSGDLTQFRTLNGKTAGPKCPTCPKLCSSGTAGTCF